MFGLDHAIASRSDGHSLLLVAVVAVLLGLRHATDPDHVAAVTTLVASTRERATRTAAALIASVSSARKCRASLPRFAPNVFVSMSSAPARM